jgi:hypothetical protein
MTKIQASIKQGEIDEGLFCDKQQGSVKMQLNHLLVIPSG